MDSVRLPSGREVAIRPIRPDDAQSLRAGYDRLSPESKYSRFLAPKPHLSSSDTTYLVQVDGCDHVALVATPVDDPGRIIGVARFVRLPEDPQIAEFAIVVGDDFQGEGLATALLQRLAIDAQGRGIARFRATMLAENYAAYQLVQRLAGGVARERLLGTVNELEIDLAS